MIEEKVLAIVSVIDCVFKGVDDIEDEDVTVLVIV